MGKGKKILSLLLAVLVLSSMIAGCSGQDSNSGVATSAQPTATSATASTATSTAASTGTPATTTAEPPKELEGTINVNTSAGVAEVEAWQAVADGYMALNPKVKVVIDLKPQDGYGDWLKNMLGTANPTADIVNINQAGLAATGKQVNFMEYVNNKSPYSNGVWKDQFNFEMQNGIDYGKNTLYNICLSSTQVAWFYNKDIFKKIGVEPPTTWKEFIGICEKLQTAGYQPLAVPGNFNSFWAMQMGWLAQIYADQTTRSMLEVYRAKEGDYNYDPDVDGKFKLDLTNPFNDDSWKVNQNTTRAYVAVRDGVYKPDSEGMKTVMSQLKEIFPKYAGGDAFFGTDDAGWISLFYQNKAAIALDTVARLAYFKNDMDKIEAGQPFKLNSKTVKGVQKFELGSFNMPSMEGAGIEAPARTIEVAQGFLGAVKKEKAHDDLVVDFFMYLSSKEGYSKYLSGQLKGGGVPNGPSLVYGVELPGEYEAMYKDLKFIGNCQKGCGQLMARGAPCDIQESLREWYGYTQEFFTGKITVDQWGEKHKTNVMKYIFKDSIKAAHINLSDLDNPANAPTGE
ncbi:MAG: ABC transporter substrate-binding protein [Clostridiaceae bacterium]